MRITRRIPDYALVTLITVLIWLYAEGRNVAAFVPPQPVPVRATLTAEDLIIIDQQPERVIPRFKGATSELDKLKRALRFGFRLEVTDTEPGTKSIVLAQALRTADPIADLNVSLISVEPETMQLEIDRLATRSVAVNFEPEQVQLVSGTQSVEPAQVQLTAPEGLLERAGIELSELVLEAEPLQDLAALPPGEPQTVRAQVVLPEPLADHPHVRVSPSEVELSFTIDRKEETLVLPTVPVQVLALPSDMSRYTVRMAEGSRLLRDVRVSGPTELIRKLRNHEVRVHALLPLSSDDLAQGVGEESVANVIFDAPPGLRVRSDDTAVRFTIGRSDEAQAMP